MDVVPERTARRVATFMRDIVAPHLLRAEVVMFSTVQTGHAQWIAGHILAHRLDRITSRDIVRAYRDLRPGGARRVGCGHGQPDDNRLARTGVAIQLGEAGIRLDRKSGGAHRIRGQGAAGARATRENPRGPRC